MGRFKDRFNSKARQGNQETDSRSVKDTKRLVEAVLDKSSLKESDYGTLAGDTNSLVVEKKEKKYKSISISKVGKKKKLTKLQRKRLEKIVERKKKKAKRAGLLKELEKHAVSESELSLMSSAARLGQLVRKRKLSESVPEIPKEAVEQNILSSVSKGRKRAKKVRLFKKAIKPLAKPENIEEDVTESESEISEYGDGDTPDNKTLLNENIEKAKTQVLPNLKIKDDSKMEEKEGTLKDYQENKHNFKEKVDCSTQPNSEKKVLSAKPAIFIEVNREPEIQAARLQLPILAEEQAVMEAISENDVVIICGETGSGKTTQVPQFLYEAGYTTKGSIGITEPRRVAAVAMSERVAKEMNLGTDKISFQIRYQGNCTDKTVMKFMTDGVLLKEVETDFLLSQYSVIVIDEAHERSVFTDILIGLLSRIVPLRNKQGKELKLVIMSATLRVADFTENTRMFPNPPISIKVDSRQFPVTVHFNKRTPDDYVEEAYRKICKIHRTLPSGGILVFVTGQSEVHTLCRKLRRTFPCNKLSNKRLKGIDKEWENEFDLNRYPVVPLTEECEAEDEIQDTGDQDKDFDDVDDSAYTTVVDQKLPLYVLPLYSLLSSKEQANVFQEAPEGTRSCVVATNVAETSLTIPHIKYVVDTGMVKKRYYDKITGVSSFKVTWTSKASANQRAGRAGRVAAGHCYRLYSSAVFMNDFDEFSEPEILRRPVDDLMLQMKSININKVINFPFPTPPSATALQAAETLLLDLGALENKKTIKGNVNAVITPLGRSMSNFPVSPRYAKMLCLGHQKNCLEYVIAIVSALTVNEIFIDDKRSAGFLDNKEELKKRIAKITQLRRSWAGYGEAQKLGDLMVLLRAVGASEYAGCTEKFCYENGLRHKGMIEIRKLRSQLTNVVNLVDPDSQVKLDPQMKPPSVDQCIALRQICLAGIGDHVARRISAEEMKDPKQKNAYICTSLEDPVFIHPKSSLFHVLPAYVVYQEIMETTKIFMKGVTAIEPDWLPILAANRCTFTKPQEDPPPCYDNETGTVMCTMACTFGPKVWQIPAQQLEYPSGLEKFKWFGRFLLEGKVIVSLEQFVPVLLGSPSSMVKSWGKLHPRTEVLLTELVSRNVDSKQRFRKALKADGSFLLDAYKKWIPKVKHKELENVWRIL